MSPRYNQERHDVNEMHVGCREETWSIHYAYAHLFRAICASHNYTPQYVRGDTSPYKACQYDRSAQLCYNWLVAQGLYDIASGEAVREKLVELAARYAQAPKFEDIATEESYPYRPFKTIYAGYKNLERLKEREFFYVFLHQDEYDIRSWVKKETSSFRPMRGWKTETKTREVSSLRLYPKALLPQLTTNLCHAKMKKFLNDRLALRARIFYNLELNNLGEDRDRFDDIAKIPNKPLSIDDLRGRIARAEDAMRFFKQLHGELGALLFKVQANSEIDFGEETYKTALEYFRENAPCYINDEDKETRQLAKLVMEGAEERRIAIEWTNEDYLKDTEE